MDNIHKVLNISLLLAVLSLILGFFIRPLYIFDGILYIILVFFFKKKYKVLNQTALSLALLSFLMVLNSLGLFGLYSISVFSVPYDKLLHFLVGVAASYSIILYARTRVTYRETIVMVLVGILGFSAFAELIEFTGALTVPNHSSIIGGFLDPGVMDILGNYVDVYYDTMTDIVLAFMGAILTLLVVNIKKGLKTTKRK